MNDLDFAGWLVFAMFAILGVGLLVADSDQERTEEQLKKWSLHWRGIPIYKKQYTSLRYCLSVVALAIAGAIYCKVLSK